MEKNDIVCLKKLECDKLFLNFRSIILFRHSCLIVLFISNFFSFIFYIIIIIYIVLYSSRFIRSHLYY